MTMKVALYKMEWNCRRPLRICETHVQAYIIIKLLYVVLTTLMLFFIEIFITWSRQRRWALFRWCTLYKAVIHTRLQQGRLLLGFDLLCQLQLPVPRPSKCSCFVFSHCARLLRPDILHTPWSSRPDTVFLLESWQRLTDFPHSTLHTVLGCQLMDFRRCCFQKICYYEGDGAQN